MSKDRKATITFAFGAALGLLAPGVAAGQTMDYGEWEKLFGEPIVASATGKPERRSEVPAAVDIITADDIRRSGATTIPEILARLASVDVYTWSRTTADVAIRGLNQGASNRLLVLVNGQEAYSDILGAMMWANIPVRLDEIRQIEVIKGPNSALYGFNAAAGVINILTYNPQFDSTKAERLTLGTDGSQEASLVQTARWDGGGVRLSGGWTKQPEVQFHPSFAINHDLAATDPSIARTLSLDSQVSVGQSSHFRMQLSATDASQRGMYLMPFYLRDLTVAGKAEFSSETPIGLIDASVMHNHIELEQLRMSWFSATDISNFSASNTNEVTVAKLQDLFKVGADDTFRVGAEYRWDDLPSYPISTADLHSETAALSGMWEHAFGTKLHLVNALRGDRFALDRSGPVLPGTPWTNADYDRHMYAWSYNSALVWQPGLLDSVKLSAGRGVTLPSLNEYALMQSLVIPWAPPFIPTALLNDIGNPTLQPTRVSQYELSYERQLPPLAGGGRVSAYHQQIDGLRDLGGLVMTSPPPALSLIGSWANVGGAHVNGIEAELTGHFAGHWRWGANYRFEMVTTTTSQTLYQNVTQPTPHHKVNANLGWADGPWEADVYLRYLSHAELSDQVDWGNFAAVRVDPVVAVASRVAYRVAPKLRLEAAASSGFADNPVASEKARVLFSVVGNF